MKHSPVPGGDLRAKILRLLDQPKYQPLDKVELTKKLGPQSRRPSRTQGGPA